MDVKELQILLVCSPETLTDGNGKHCHAINCGSAKRERKKVVFLHKVHSCIEGNDVTFSS